MAAAIGLWDAAVGSGREPRGKSMKSGQLSEPSRNTAVRIEKDAASTGVVRIVVDNPPVNAGSLAVRAGLLEALETIAADPAVEAAILIGAGTTFIAGSDIREFGAPLVDPQMPAVIAAIEACPKPVIAAIHGAALGGGYEVALGCDARIATPSAVVGLPEVTLGMIPGAGGTVRLPRLVDSARAIELIVGARRVGGHEAVDLGMVDVVTDEDLTQRELANFACRYASTWSAGKRRLRDKPVLPFDKAALEMTAAAALRKAKGRPAAAEAIAAVKRAADAPFDVALAEERAVFQRLRESEEAAALRHLFFAERSAGRVKGDRDAGSAIRSVAVVGAGTMGAGIASAFIAGGFLVTLVDSSEDALGRGRTRIAEIDREDETAGRIDAAEHARRRDRLVTATDLEAVASADLVVEAIFEDMAIKTEMFAQLDRIARPGAVLATNTSYLDLNEIAAATGRPEAVVGLHFFSPAHRMRLVEVVRGAKTALDVLAAATAVARHLKKLPVIAGVAEGFIGNRIFSAYRTQCEYLLEDGAMPEDVDRALTDFGFAMGPFAVWDLSGLDIAWRTRQRLAEMRDPDERSVPFLDALYERGRLGRKTGAGWYRYQEGAKAGVPDPEVDALIRAGSAAKGILRRDVPDEEIVSRALGAMVNEAALVMAEGVAERASDIDLVLVNGYGFPAYRGGPLFWASRRPRADIERAVDRVAAASGPAFRRGPIHELLGAPA